MPSFVFVRHQCGRCEERVESRATDDAGQPVTTAPAGWSRGQHKGADYQVCAECLHVGGMGAWLANPQREHTMGTTLRFRHDCDRCHATEDTPARDSGMSNAAPPDWILLTVQGRPQLLCPVCIAALRAFMEANVNAETSP